MTIRAALDSDIPAIVELLKLSLGESLMPKSEAFWRWKHVDNPFGKSPVLLALDEDRLIGVRAFMRWEWKRGDTIYKAVRAVDTATHPAYQGKGIFSKLTLQLVDRCREEGVDFIFNTPNKKSMPGYLKMGWQEVGRLRVGVRPILITSKQRHDFDEVFGLSESMLERFRNFAKDSNRMYTNASAAYLNWRYLNNSNIKYYGAGSDADGYFLIFRLKHTRMGVEFRICELTNDPNFSKESLCKMLLKVAKASGARFLSSAESLSFVPSLILPMGPVVTVHTLAGRISLNFENWKPTLGDLEVF